MKNHPGSLKDIEHVLATAQLPALPQSAIRLLELSHDPENGPAEYAIPIESDPGLAGQVLRFVNSSYFGFAREISNVKLAINLVGVATIKNFALWSAVFSLIPNPRCGPFDLRTLWQDSLRRAIFARNLAKLVCPKEAEDCFAAALLQDMAIPLLAKELTSVYVRLLGARKDGQHRLSHLEREYFGWTHGEAAARIAATWNLPELIAEMIRNHDQPNPPDNPKGSPRPGSLVALSAFLPAISDPQWHEREIFEQCFEQTTNRQVALPEILEKVDQQFAEFAPIFKMAKVKKALFDHYQEGVVATH